MATKTTQIFLGSTSIPFYYLGEDQVGLFPKSEPSVPRDGLIFDIDATKASSYPGSGSTWFSIGGGPDVIPFTGSAFPTWDATNKQFNFNGSSNTLIGNFTSSIGTNTMITWIRVGTIDPTGAAEGGGMNYGSRVVSNAQAAFNAISYDEANTRFRMVSTGGANAVNANIQTNTEYELIAAVRESGSFRIYVNGALEGTNTSLSPDAGFVSGSYIIGSRFIGPLNTPQGYFTGSISRVAVYNRVLNTEEINGLYEIGRFGG
jgi:hypothetical protein